MNEKKQIEKKLFTMDEDIRNALDTLRRGGVILYPTDTVWGIGCDATNEAAVARVFALKRRADSKAMLTLIDSTAKLSGYVDEIPDVAYDLIEMSNKPLTIIYSGAKNLARNLLADDGSVGIRVTNERFSKCLCERFHKPIVSTSANISGEPAPRTFAEISDEVRAAVDYICTTRRDEAATARPSSIIKLGAHAEVQVIRP